MTCKSALARIAALMDGELSATAVTRVRDHLAGCAECAHAAEETERLGHLAAAWTAAGGDIWESVRAAMGETDVERLAASVRALEAEVGELRTEVAILRTQRFSIEYAGFHAGTARRKTPASRPQPCLRIV